MTPDRARTAAVSVNSRSRRRIVPSPCHVGVLDAGSRSHRSCERHPVSTQDRAEPCHVGSDRSRSHRSCERQLSFSTHDRSAGAGLDTGALGEDDDDRRQHVVDPSEVGPPDVDDLPAESAHRPLARRRRPAAPPGLRATPSSDIRRRCGARRRPGQAPPAVGGGCRTRGARGPSRCRPPPGLDGRARWNQLRGRRELVRSATSSISSAGPDRPDRRQRSAVWMNHSGERPSRRALSSARVAASTPSTTKAPMIASGIRTTVIPSCRWMSPASRPSIVCWHHAGAVAVPSVRHRDVLLGVIGIAVEAVQAVGSPVRQGRGRFGPDHGDRCSLMPRHRRVACHHHARCGPTPDAQGDHVLLSPQADAGGADLSIRGHAVLVAEQLVEIEGGASSSTVIDSKLPATAGIGTIERHESRLTLTPAAAARSGVRSDLTLTPVPAARSGVEKRMGPVRARRARSGVRNRA